MVEQQSEYRPTHNAKFRWHTCLVCQPPWSEPATLTVNPSGCLTHQGNSLSTLNCMISIQGLLHVGLHCNKLWSAGAVPGYQQHIGLVWGLDPGGLDMCLSGLSPNSETPYTIVSGLLSYLRKLRVVSNQDQNTPPCQTIGPENNTLPRQKLWKTPLRAAHPQYTKYSQSPRSPPGPLLSKNGELQKWSSVNKP